jgi:hypothetical protein
MPALDLVAHVNELQAWGAHEENTALLLEQQAYRLGLLWSDRTVDPEDPDVVAQRERADAAGIKPPPFPPVPPIAHRPWKHSVDRLHEFADRMSPYLLPAEPSVDELNPDDVLDEWLMANDWA